MSESEDLVETDNDGNERPSFGECEGVFISFELFPLPKAIRDSYVSTRILVILVILVY